MRNLRLRILTSGFKSQLEFSLETGIHESILSKICRGITKPSTEQRELITAALKKRRQQKYQGAQ